MIKHKKISRTGWEELPGIVSILSQLRNKYFFLLAKLTEK